MAHVESAPADLPKCHSFLPLAFSVPLAWTIVWVARAYDPSSSSSYRLLGLFSRARNSSSLVLPLSIPMERPTILTQLICQPSIGRERRDIHNSTYPYLGYHRQSDDPYSLYPSICIDNVGIASYIQFQSCPLSSALNTTKTYQQERFPIL
jgi:hypothetical protein